MPKQIHNEIPMVKNEHFIIHYHISFFKVQHYHLQLMLSHVNTIFINSIYMVDTEVAKKNLQKDTVGFFFLTKWAVW